MAAQQSQIQTLLEAEQGASQIVQQARQYRDQRLKDALTQANKEIAAYDMAKNQEFGAFVASHAGTTSTSQVALDNDTDIRIREIDAVFKTRKDGVVKSLLARATLVHPKLHPNLKKVNA